MGAKGLGGKAASVVLTALACSLVFSGFSLASDLYTGSQPLLERGTASWNGQSQADPDFPTAPSLSLATTAASVSACTSSLTVSLVSVNTAVLSAVTGGECGGAWLAEQLSFTFPATTVSETDTLSVTTSWVNATGSPFANQTSSLALTLPAGSTVAGAGLNVLVAYAKASPESITSFVVTLN